ncbi:MAG: protein-disulfide isomerase, partial [Spirochaetia bacterium]|nr:protein-disulfide isomerase [Spirochaetia bacterium]
MTSQNTKNYNLYILISSFIGIILSFFLIREFYGTAGDFVSSLCSISGSENGCEKVANSSYSGFRNLPFFGDIPVALFGFVYYGLIFGIAYLDYKSENVLQSGYIELIYLFAVIGLLMDVILFSISLFIIKAVCILCISTYIVTIAILLIAHISLKKQGEPQTIMDSLRKNVFSSLKTNLLNYIIIILFLLTCGIGGGRYSSNSQTTSMGEESDKNIIQKKIDAYEKGAVLKLETKGIPFSGDEKAPITIVKFADFNCGHCMHTSVILRQILQEYSGLVKVYYKNFPLDGNCNRLVSRKSPDGSSCVAAGASICASAQNKFKNVYEELYNDNERGIRHSTISVVEIAKKNNLNLQTFNTCMSSKEVSDSI